MGREQTIIVVVIAQSLLCTLVRFPTIALLVWTSVSIEIGTCNHNKLTYWLIDDDDDQEKIPHNR